MPDVDNYYFLAYTIIHKNLKARTGYPDCNCDGKILCSEVEAAISRLKNGKSSGVDGVAAEKT